MTLLAQQHLSFCGQECQTACLGILTYYQFPTRLLIAVTVNGYVLGLRCHHKRLSGLSFDHMDNPGCNECYLHLLRPTDSTRHDQRHD